MTSHLVKWDRLYRDQGLTIIDVNEGTIDTQNALTAYVQQHGKSYATLWDEGGKVCRQYAIRAYPSAFLIGVDGKVIWEGFPVPELEQVERLLQQELAKVARNPATAESARQPPPK